MAENESSPRPHFQSLQKLGEYFDFHYRGEHWDRMPEAYFKVDLKRRPCLISIDEDLMSKFSDMAKARQVSVEVLINAWFRKRLREQVVKSAPNTYEVPSCQEANYPQERIVAVFSAFSCWRSRQPVSCPDFIS